MIGLISMGMVPQSLTMSPRRKRARIGQDRPTANVAGIWEILLDMFL